MTKHISTTKSSLVSRISLTLRSGFSYQNGTHAQFTLMVLRGMLTLVGGKVRDKPTNFFLRLISQERREKKWQPHYPPMPTKRYCTAAICSSHSLILAGGNGGQGQLLATVEVLDVDTRQWYSTSSLLSNIIKGTISST